MTDVDLTCAVRLSAFPMPRLPVRRVRFLEDQARPVELDRCGRRRSRATYPEFRRGVKPGNHGKRYVIEVLTREDFDVLMAGLSKTSSERLRARCSDKHHWLDCARNYRLESARRGPECGRMSTPNIPVGFCQCGCGRKTNIAKTTDPKWGWVKGTPVRFIRGHGSYKPGPRYVIDPDTGCWVWQLHKSNGYGRITVGRVRQWAHRYYYEQLVGPIPSGLELDHLCRNRACVNPAHLEPVTRTENLRRGMGPAAVNARKTHCVNGHPLGGENLYVDPKRGRRQCRICRKAAGDRARQKGAKA